MSQQSARSQRSTGGMVGAMIVLVLVVVGWVAFRGVVSPQKTTPVRTVDYAQVVPSARKAAGFHLVAPPRLPRGWRATTVNFSPQPDASWHLGVLTVQNRYVGLEQANRPVSSMVDAYVDQAAVRGPSVDVAGQPWSTYTDSQGDVALVRQAARTTTLVVGHEVARGALVSYAASLR